MDLQRGRICNKGTGPSAGPQLAAVLVPVTRFLCFLEHIAPLVQQTQAVLSLASIQETLQPTSGEDIFINRKKGKMCTTALLSAKSMFLSSPQQVFIGHPLATYTLRSKIMAPAPVKFTL